YYGSDNAEFSKLRKLSNYAFRTQGGKFQNLKRFVTQKPRFFDQYSHVWICDDDIQMSPGQINEAFAIADFYSFWIAQPAFHPDGKNSHSITLHNPDYDYRVVNFIECGVPIFRRDKLAEFLNTYDGSLTGWGIDYWYSNLFRPRMWERFASLFTRNKL